MAARDHDPFTLAVIQAGLVAAADEMFSVLKKTAMSPIIYEVLDVGTGITDARGQLVSSGAGIPTFVGVLDKAVRRILDLHPPENIVEGDLFITNDPYFGGVTHLNDVVVAQPVFAGERLVAWSASIAHWNDVGGKTPGSMATDVVEIHQEGLRLPAVRLVAHGEPLQAVLDIIAANSRQPDFVRGDLWAQIAASRRAADRIRSLVKNYGAEIYETAISRMFDEGEQRSLDGLTKLKHGTFGIREPQDDGTIWQAGITIAADRMLVDLRGNPAQLSAPYNTSRDGAVIACQMIFKALADPSLFANAGSFRPLEVLTEPGTVFHATGSAPHGYYFETRIKLYDMLWHCLAQAMPDRLPAGHFASICGTVVAGTHPRTGRRFTMVEPQMGGWGGTAKRPGLDAMYSASHGETYNCPVEVAEARYGLTVVRKKLNESVPSTAVHSGGRGLEVVYEMNGTALLSAGFSHFNVPVWGGNGGGEGGRNRLRVLRSDGRVESRPFLSGVRLEPFDRVLITTANGGGWGSGNDLAAKQTVPGGMLNGKRQH